MSADFRVIAGEYLRDILDQPRALEETLESFGTVEATGGPGGAPTSEFDCFHLADHGSSVRAILEILPIHMITPALAALAGREAGKFELATKVTTTE